MAQRRMFSKQIIESDAFLDLSKSAQILYIHLCMSADDDGVINNAMRVLRVTGCRRSDLEALTNVRFVLKLGGSLFLIKHWKINNSIRVDRYKPTEYQEELDKVEVKPNNSYTIGSQNVIPTVIPSDIPKVDTRLPQVSIGKYSIGKYSIYGQNDLTESVSEEKIAPAQVDKTETKKETKKSCRYDMSLFDKLWEAYPRKIGKSKCKSWFESRKPNEELVNTMIATIDKFKASDEWKDIKYVPHPYTWLNRGGWEDELASEESRSTGAYATTKEQDEANQKIVDSIDLDEIFGEFGD